ncbi:corticotropin-releasing factor receptor 2-like [Condylostylus longicornis]|uniref:corticotropin-releasing factor receptor 2-like n=1 Tax=Condylostylus longicornis TaxID=2530218 RepID=UPI00244DF990|nr:corticotropin-releasing factor receptor 2-like [Condylostylus longicornis]
MNPQVYIISGSAKIVVLALKTCNYRSLENLPPKIFAYHACWGCYIYNRPDIFVNNTPVMAITCPVIQESKIFEVPGIKTEMKCVPFHYSHVEIDLLISKSFKWKDSVEKWISCSKDAEKCCHNVMFNENEESDKCKGTWDGWTCFESTKAGTVNTKVCSQYAYTNQPPRCHHFCHKLCFENGTWQAHTNYATCDVTPTFLFRLKWNLGTLATSAIFCVPAAFILLIFRDLKAPKLKMIRNLILSIILHNILLLLVKIIIIYDELTTPEHNTVMSNNRWPCKLLTFLEKLSGNFVFTFMLFQAIYLHQLLTNPFKFRRIGDTQLITLQFCGIFLSSIFVFGWAIAMVLYNDDNCWQVTDGTMLSWLINIPRLIMLIINLLLLIHIVWTLWSAFKSREGELQPNLRTVKVSLLCLPLFGIPFLFMVVHPYSESCELLHFYYISMYLIEGAQGILIAIFHCYTEKEIPQITIIFDEIAMYIKTNFLSNIAA